MKLLLVILCLYPCLVFSQNDLVFDTLHFGQGVREVELYRKYVSENKDKLVRKYIFNKKGQHILTYNGYDSPWQSKQIFEYNQNQLISHKTIRSSSFKNNVDWRKHKRIDSTLYECVDPEKVNWDASTGYDQYITVKYGSHEKVSTYYIYEQSSKKEFYLDEKITLSYQSNGKLEKQTYSQVENANIYKFQAFKSSSAELSDTIKLISNVQSEKLYRYCKDTCLIYYYVNGKQTGLERQIYDPIRRVKKYIVSSSLGDTLSVFTEKYNESKRLIVKKRLLHKGINGFAYYLDLTPGDEFHYYYDELGRLSQINCFDKGKLYYREKFKIIAKK